MELPDEDIAQMMEVFLHEARHKTYFGILKHEGDIKGIKYTIRADSFTGYCRFTYKGDIIVYNSNNGVVSKISGPSNPISGANEAKGIAIDEPYSTLMTMHFSITKKSTEAIWKVLLIKFFRNIVGVFVDNTSHGIVGMTIGILLTIVVTLVYQWL